MSRRSDAALASLLLTSGVVDAGADAQPLPAKDYWALIGVVGDPGTLLELGHDELDARTAQAAVDADRVRARLDCTTSLAFRLDELDHAGIWTLTPYDADYPQRLRDRLESAAPPVLYGIGDPGLIDMEGLAIVGPVHLPHATEMVAAGAGALAAADMQVLLTGGSGATHDASMQAVVEAGGSSVSVIPDSLLRRCRDAATRRLALEGATCIVTPYGPDTLSTPQLARGRNKIVYALASKVLVLSTEVATGDVWSGAVEALRYGYCEDVAVWTGPGAGAGNRALIEEGCRAVDDLAHLSDSRTVGQPTPGAPGQLGLGL